MNSELETVINCPLCGKEITTGLERAGGMAAIAAMFLGGDGKQESYKADAKCPACGARVMATLTVTAMKAERK